ncbi:DUF5082 family protein [Pseudoflavonifractor capillosus]|uniref:YwqH-like family protein n=1 Tax=Pseudoflavonifractor capillosus TaxID=106588 RepID=UPI00195AB7D5|nr:DUF5082 family protein [Pseudoflavonifractor capillosus]MBM6694901.1 DUF5082 family protein [Pseudoflavonifractor capillosus]
MSDNAEYDRLVSQKSSAQSQYNACSSRIEDCDYLLRRLRPAKESIVELKEAFKSNRNADKDLYDEKHDWKGSTYNLFNAKMSTLIEVNDIYYKDSIDHVLDSLNDEITRIENQRMREYGLLGRLGSWINNLSNEIENFFN